MSKDFPASSCARFRARTARRVRVATGVLSVTLPLSALSRLRCSTRSQMRAASRSEATAGAIAASGRLP
jgi:hypothetical protein